MPQVIEGYGLPPAFPSLAAEVPQGHEIVASPVELSEQHPHAAAALERLQPQGRLGNEVERLCVVVEGGGVRVPAGPPPCCREQVSNGLCAGFLVGGQCELAPERHD